MAKVPVTVELYYSGAWHNITALDHVYTRDPITITRPEPSDPTKSARPPSSLALTLNNRDGRYSPRNPRSPLYGLIGRNTPIRVSVTNGYRALSISGTAGNYASTPDNAVLDIVGDIDLRADLTIDNWASGFISSPITKWNQVAVNQRGYAFQVRADGTLQLSWSTNGSNVLTATSTVSVPSTTGRLAIRVTMDVDNGASGRTITFYTAPTSAGPYVQLGAQVVQAVVTTIFNSDALVQVGTHSGSDVAGAGLYPSLVNNVQILNGIAGTVVANPDFSVQPPGNSSFADPSGRIWTMNGDAAILPSYRFTGEVESWPQRWDVSGKDVWVPITANGITRRLNAPGTSQPTSSALKRAIPSQSPVEYWTLEDASGAQQAGSALSGGAPLILGTVAPTFGVSGLSGSASSAEFANSGQLTVDLTSVQTSWSLSFATAFQMQVQSPMNLMTIQCLGGVRVVVKLDIDIISVSCFGPNNTDGLSGTTKVAVTTLANVTAHHVVVNATQSGGNVSLTLRVDGNLEDTASLTTATCYTPQRITIGDGTPSGSDTSLLMAHFFTTHTVYTGDLSDAATAYVGETAAARIVRLCGEEGVSLTTQGDTADTELMGVQRVVPFLELLQDAADADGGILTESRAALALKYRTFKSLYNQDPALRLNYASGGEVAPPLEPVEDTDATGNDITVTRLNGSSARLVKTTGTLNVNLPSDDPKGVGTYKKDISLVLYADSQCLQQAAWRRHLGTWDEARYPVVNLDLTAMAADGKTSLATSALALDIGDRLSVANPPAWLPPDSIVQHAQGFVETIESHHHTISAYATPALPYDVLELETSTADNLSRVPAGVTTLNGSLTSTTTSVAITSATARWIDSATYSAQFPFDVLIGGEQMRVTALTGTILTQTMTVVRSVNGVVKTQASGAPVQLFRPPVIAR